MRTILFRHKHFRIRHIAELMRHAERAIPRHLGMHPYQSITKKGYCVSFAQGKKLPRDFSVVLYSSRSSMNGPEILRTRQTAVAIQKGARGTDVNMRRVIKSHWEVGFWRVKNIFALEKFARKRKLDPAGLFRWWMAGKIPHRFLALPGHTANVAIRNSFWLARARSRRGWRLLSITVSHDWTLAAVFKRLTGKMLTRLPDFNESLRLFITDTDRAILEFRRKRFDVTRRLFRVLRHRRRFHVH